MTREAENDAINFGDWCVERFMGCRDIRTAKFDIEERYQTLLASKDRLIAEKDATIKAHEAKIAEKEALARGRLEQLHILGKAKVECEKELQAYKEGLRVAREALSEISDFSIHIIQDGICVYSKIARETLPKLNELIGEKP